MSTDLDAIWAALDVLDPPKRPSWRDTARPDQLPPDGPWRTIYFRGGRGGGKTWTGSNILAELIVQSEPGEWGVIAPTYADARDTCIESSESGLIKALGGRVGASGSLFDKGLYIASWNRSMGDLRLNDGSVVYIDGADDGAYRIQGKNLRGVWGDECGLWRRWQTAWDESIRYAVRKAPAKMILTGTPKRHMPARALVKRLLTDPNVISRRLLTADNADNLDPAALADLMELQGTTLGRQELTGDLIEDVEGALFSMTSIEDARIPDNVWGRLELSRIAVGVDPAITSGEASDDTGIVAVGVGYDHHLYVLADWTCHGPPEKWAKRVCELYHQLQADFVVAENNQGGDMVTSTLRVADPTVPVTTVWSKRGKALRAEPLSVMYEQGRVHHIGWLSDLEAQMVSWEPGGPSPDRLDALVHAATALAVQHRDMKVQPYRDVRAVGRR